MKGFKAIRHWVLLKTARMLVLRLGLKAKWFGYRVIQASSIERYLRSNKYSSRLIALDSLPFNSPLPLNIRSEEGLVRDKVWGKSFHDVLQRNVLEAFVATVDNCRIISYYDQWNNEFSVILDEDYCTVPVGAIGFLPGHRSLLKAGGNVAEIGEASWILENWSGNYYHWLVYHLPKVLLLKRHAPHLKIIIPSRGPMLPVMFRSLEMMGYKSTSLLKLEQGITTVTRLTVLGLDQHDPRLLQDLARMLVVQSSAVPSELIYISRKKATWRRIVNEDDVISALELMGFKIVEMEGLDFDGQIAAVRSARIVLAAHGAGLANMLFAPSGAHIVEIMNPGFPNPDYYRLASSLQHRYWLFEGQPVGDKPPAFQDIFVPVDRLVELLNRSIGA